MSDIYKLLCLFLICQLPSTSQATEEDSWVGFYARKATTPAHEIRHSGNSCENAILAAQEKHGIPDNLLLAIGIQEAGRLVDGALTVWPWTGNADGKGKFFATKAALKAWVGQSQARGIRSIDVGCMQINQKWHAGHFASLEEATDPFANADYAARFLRQLFQETGDWWEAAGRYHSSTHVLKDRYLKRLTESHRLAKLQAIPLRQPASTTLRTTEGSTPNIRWSAEISGSSAPSPRDYFSIYSGKPLETLFSRRSEEN